MVHATQVKVKTRIFRSGHCLADAQMVNPQARRETIRFYATWLLLVHPVHGNILFDTGYTTRFYRATARLPYKFYAWATPVFVTEPESAVAQLRSIGILPETISTILISHFHADHIGGLRDFPDSRFVCSQSALDEAVRKKGFAAVRKGILPGLLPHDLRQRTTVLESLAEPRTEAHSGLVMYDLFGDGSVQLIELPGHARGMLGARIEHAGGAFLFAADAFWDIRAFEAGIMPRKVVKLFFDSWRDYVSSFEKLSAYHRVWPFEKILFSHCPETPYET